MPAEEIVKTSTRAILLALVLALVAASCGSDAAESAADAVEEVEASATDAVEAEPEEAPEAEAAEAEPVAAEGEGCPTLTLVTYDSFLVSEGLFDTFTADTCIGVEQVAGGDTGQMVAACLLYTSPSPRDATLSRMPSSA